METGGSSQAIGEQRASFHEALNRHLQQVSDAVFVRSLVHPVAVTSENRRELWKILRYSSWDARTGQFGIAVSPLNRERPLPMPQRRRQALGGNTGGAYRDRAVSRPKLSGLGPSMTATILMSGGLDSTACAAFYKQRCEDVKGIHVDYGQLPAKRERNAVKKIAKSLEIELTIYSVATSNAFGTGELRGRNAFLIMSAIFLAGC